MAQNDSILPKKDSIITGLKGGKGNLTTGFVRQDSISSLPTTKELQDTTQKIAITDTVSQDSIEKISIPPSLYTIRQWERKAWEKTKPFLPPIIGRTLSPLSPNGHPDPKVAWVRAAVLPGWGQAYNRRYWKIPIVYVALGGVGYLAYSNHSDYKQYQKAYLYDIDGNPNTNKTQVDPDFANINTAGLRFTRDQRRDTRDRMLLITGIVYALQIVEAYVDAHLHAFDISEDLSLHPQPISTPVFSSSRANIGMGLSFSYKF